MARRVNKNQPLLFPIHDKDMDPWEKDDLDWREKHSGKPEVAATLLIEDWTPPPTPTDELPF